MKAPAVEQPRRVERVRVGVTARRVLELIGPKGHAVALQVERDQPWEYGVHHWWCPAGCTLYLTQGVRLIVKALAERGLESEARAMQAKLDEIEAEQARHEAAAGFKRPAPTEAEIIAKRWDLKEANEL